MINRIKGWFRLLGVMPILWRKSASQKLAWKWKRKAAKQLRLLNRASKQLRKESDRLGIFRLECDRQLNAFAEDIERRVKDVENRVEAAQHAIRQFDKVEEALNDDLKVREASIEGMSFLLEEINQRARTNIATLAREEVAVTLPGEVE
jgi:hypothetical protein